jgi:Ran GTPase-activating protein (RanGAP) involved in mRNA processing and transport
MTEKSSLLILKADIICQIFRGMTLSGRVLCKRFLELLPKENCVNLALTYTTEFRSALEQGVQFLNSFSHLQFSLQLESGANSISKLPKGELDTFLRRTSGLTTIDVRKNGLGRWGHGSMCLYGIIAASPRLRRLDAAQNELGSLGTRHLAMGIAKTPHLVSLDLSHNKLGDDGTANLAPGLCLTVFLSELVLSRNGIGPAGAAHLAQAMLRLTELESLNLANNVLGPTGTAQLSVGLFWTTRLEKLDLSWNGVGTGGVPRAIDRDRLRSIRSC